LGFFAIGAAIAIAVAHFAFGLPIPGWQREEPSSDMSIVAGLTFFAAMGLLFALHGVSVMRGRPKQDGS
jgi:hypothetical protein